MRKPFAPTRAMLGSVRTEVLQRIDQAREVAKADAQRLDGKVDAVKAEVYDVKAVVHAVQAHAARIELLVEEQSARDKIVLDGIRALLSRQEQVEQRLANVEQTLRTLAAARPAPNPA